MAVIHHPMLDVLKGTSLRTASLRLAELGPPAIVATIDGAQYTISKASVRSAAEAQGERPAELADQPPIPDPIPSPPKFMQKTTSLESELKDTKKTLGTAIITLSGEKNDMDSLLALENASLAEQQSSFVTPSKNKDSGVSSRTRIKLYTLSHLLTFFRKLKTACERFANSPTQVLSRITPGGLTHSSANQDIPIDIFVTPGNMPISIGSGTDFCGHVLRKRKGLVGGSLKGYNCSKNRHNWRDNKKNLILQVELFARSIRSRTLTSLLNKANEELSRTLIGSNLPEGDFASAMVEMVDRKRRQIAEQKAKTRRDRPMTKTYGKSLIADSFKKSLKAPESSYQPLLNKDFTRASKRLVTYYQDKEVDRVGLILWGDLRGLIDSPKVDDGIISPYCQLMEDVDYQLKLVMERG
ncbi:hypothetical protein Tco_0842307 [Tanacetum coccineum]|uniref:Uncharacterized protein n=1 Tax=Tanacetum coccineum TaxID=301880 RepID=A0ABQ5AYX6_9ASTR